MSELTDIERQLLDLLLDGALPQLETLRRQLEAAKVSARQFSGVGLFTEFEVPPAVPRVNPPDFVLGDISFELESVENGGEALLFVRGGVLEMLEVYNWTDSWPDSPKLRRATYVRPAQPLPANPLPLVPTESRDLEFVAAEIRGEVHERPSA